MMFTFSATRKRNGCLLLGLLTLDTVVAGATIPTSPGGVQFTTRDAHDRLEGFLDQFKASIPAVTQAGIDLYNKIIGGLLTAPYTTTTSFTRGLILATVRLNFRYGPPVAGGPYYPTGLLGNAKVVQDAANLEQDLVPRLAAATLDLAKATVDIPKVRQTWQTGI